MTEVKRGPELPFYEKYVYAASHLFDCYSMPVLLMNMCPWLQSCILLRYP